MAEATSDTILGDFADARLDHYNQQAHFTTQNGQYWVSLEHGEKHSRHQILYTFGHYPLQQYLVAGERSRLQVLPYAWDSRVSGEGGQKWYPIYQNENIQPNDRLHWQQPLQTWNGMCADCHSDGLQRNYTKNTDSFATKWDKINVGCQSCHGDVPADHAKSNAGTLAVNDEIKAWVRELTDDTASWQGPARDKSAMQTCYACHSLRSPLVDGIQHGEAFLDQFSPRFINTPLYHADGQIKEEVYVYGSFLQSKMYAAGVNCLDCHDSHSMKVKIQGNGLCLQCHSPTTFNHTNHHGHDLDTAGSQCVDCHMPSTRYMGVDDRRDHSFSIPRPQLSQQFDIPHACKNCHADQTDDWASKALQQWRTKSGKTHESISQNELSFLRLQTGVAITFPQHLAIIADAHLDIMTRATAITLLPNTTTQLPEQVIAPWVNSDEPLIRLATAEVGQLLPDFVRQQSYAMLLKDKYRAVRVAAANHLINSPALKNKQQFQAFQELHDANELNGWRGEGNLNTSMLHMQAGQHNQAITALEHSIRVDPYFAEAYVNLSDIYRLTGNSDAEQATFAAGLLATPKSAVLQYAYGLHLIRGQQRQKAVTAFSTALKLAPENAQYAYVYTLSLDGVGRTKQAIAQLKTAIHRYQDNAQLAQLGMNLSQKVNDSQSVTFFSKLIRAVK